MKCMNQGKALAASMLVAALGTTASAGIIEGTVIKSFSLFNHPDGNVDPSAYGLRLDYFPYGGYSWDDDRDDDDEHEGGHEGDSLVTFSFEEEGSSTMSLDVVDTGGGINLHIFGTMWGNSATGGSDLGLYNLNVWYLDVDILSDGWEVNDDTGFIGMISPADAQADSVVGEEAIIGMYSKADEDGLVFSFRDEEHRGNPGWNGFGWVKTRKSWGTQDFLFRAEMDMPGRVIPLPSAAGMGLAGLLGLGVIRRRR